MLFTTSGATNLVGTAYSDSTQPVAPGGVLVSGVTAIQPKYFIDIIDSSELARFGLQNGGAFDQTLISGKWESSALASCLDPAHPQDYFLFSVSGELSSASPRPGGSRTDHLARASDNDFITQNGVDGGKPYADSTGLEVNTQILVWRITLP